MVGENFLKKLPVTDRLLPTSDIIKNACKTEVVSFLLSVENKYAVLLYNSHSVTEEMLRLFSREHIFASGFVNTPNGFEMLSQGGPARLQPAGGRDAQSCKLLLCSLGISGWRGPARTFMTSCCRTNTS